MLVDRGGMWFRVLAARYGVEGDRVREGGRKGSAWWREMVRIRDGVGGFRGGWFRESVAKKVGDGSGTFFWTDPWLGGVPLRERFGRLFELAENKSSSVAEMFHSGWEGGGEAWVWRRQLWVWEEEMLRECQTLLLPFTVQDDTPDLWKWQPDPDTGYSVRGAYQLLTSQDPAPLGTAEDLVWHRQVPLKVSIFAWRLLRDRLPTKSNLVARGIISPEAHLCVTGCGGIETAQHIFISCSTFASLWGLVRSWIGSSAVDAHALPEHFVQFTSSDGGPRARQSFLQLIWLACTWVIWNERNQRLFRNTENSVHHLLGKVKMFSFRWLRTTNATLGINLHCWWSNPLLCLDID
ncbi:hypothetical protein QL285_070265 [Trifolium repens]|nr:hypothetical protein QL285_070265 [Trifolium repens]